jgi:hypothetical protein
MGILDQLTGGPKSSPLAAEISLTEMGKRMAESVRGQGMLGTIIDIVEDDGPCTIQHVVQKSGLKFKDVDVTIRNYPAYFVRRQNP